MSHIFGPVPSRRLGLSLGIDLIPAKTCTYDCLYCQVGRTTCKTIETKSFVPLPEVFDELERTIQKTEPDTITLSGSGEPTLHAQIDQVIAFIKRITDTRIAVLTNGSLLWREDVRRRISDADIIMPTLSTAFDKTFRTIHRPHSKLSLNMIIEGLKGLRGSYHGRLFLEVVLLAGINESDIEIEGLKRVIEEIAPEKVQLNTVVRPPSDSRAISLDRERLEEIKGFLGKKAEIIAEAPLRHYRGAYDSVVANILDMAKRRPLRTVDIAHVLNLGLDEVEILVKGLCIKGLLSQQEHSDEVYYLKKSP